MEEITQAHRAAAAAAHATGHVLVLDRGAKDNADHPATVAVRMAPIDATHAAAADPERYLIVPRADREPVTLEERMNRVEQMLELGQWAKPDEDADPPAKLLATPRRRFGYGAGPTGATGPVTA